MAQPLFDRAAVLDGLEALAFVLGQRSVPHQTLAVIGGSYLALLGLREATRDVDTITRLNEQTRRAIDDVARSKGLEPRWLNDAAIAFTPIGLTSAHCSPVFAHKALTVVLPSPDWVFLMKLYAARAVDYQDLVALWPLCEFSSPADAVEKFWLAYPHASDDDFLIDYVAQIAAQTS